MNLDKDFWSGRRVFLTGHTGFKGTWMSLVLEQLGSPVTGFSLRPEVSPSLFEECRQADSHDSVIGDIRDYESLLREMRRTRPEIVIHMAAQSLVTDSYNDPLKTFTTNVIGTANVLEAIRQVDSVRAAVIVTSDKCYQNTGDGRPYNEDDPLGGHDPYSSSKACAEIVTASYREAFIGPKSQSDRRLAISSVRAGNVIGGGDWSRNRLIPDSLASFEKGEPPRLRYPNSTRPWQHVLDPVVGYLLLAEKMYLSGQAYSGAWNFGPSRSETSTVAEVVMSLARKMGAPEDYFLEADSVVHEAITLQLDSSKASRVLGWTSVWDLEETLDEISYWHKAFLEGVPAKQISIGTIGRYFNRQNEISSRSTR